MKTPLLSAALVIGLILQCHSQSCGISGPGQCTPTGIFPPGHFTSSEDIACIMRGQVVNSTSEFTSFDTVQYAGMVLTVNSMRIDSIGNLPVGLCWSTNAPNDSFTTSQPGCIHVSGITYADPGQYKLFMLVTVNLGFIQQQVNADAVGLKIFLRLIDSSISFCPQLDTSQTAANPLIPYNNLYTNVAQITGNLFFDANHNHSRDIGEQPVRNQWVAIGNNNMAITNQSGNYYAYQAPGTLTLRPALSGNIAGFGFTPDSLVVHADSIGVSYPGNDFGILSPPNYCQGTISMVGTNPPPRPGFNNQVNISYTNVVSAATVSEIIYFSYDSRQSYVNASPAPASIDTINRVITWNATNLNSGSTWQASVTLHTPQTLAIGSVLRYSEWISGSSCTPFETLQTDEEITVVGSYDPNDKSVSPVGLEPGGRILPNSVLSYTIRFQNTGTYPAENVRVTDVISPLLDISSLKVLAASHPYEVIFMNREVTFLFSQINLADSFSNEPLSHGYIKYSIQPASSFIQNSLIQNVANIYFDFNTPVITNTTINTADNSLGMPDLPAGNATFQIYPNPLSEGNWQLVVSGELSGKEINIYDVQGKLIQALRILNRKTEIDASRYPKGIYLIRVGGAVSKIIKL